MIQVQILASSSKGNAYIIRDGSQSVLIDPGLPYRELQKTFEFHAVGAGFRVIIA